MNRFRNGIVAWARAEVKRSFSFSSSDPRALKCDVAVTWVLPCRARIGYDEAKVSTALERGLGMNEALHHDQPWPRARVTIMRLAPLLILLALVLFPLGWLGEVWRPFGRLIDRVFPTAREHAFGHGSLFLL